MAEPEKGNECKHHWRSNDGILRPGSKQIPLLWILASFLSLDLLNLLKSCKWGYFSLSHRSCSSQSKSLYVWSNSSSKCLSFTSSQKLLLFAGSNSRLDQSNQTSYPEYVALRARSPWNKERYKWDCPFHINLFCGLVASSEVGPIL